MVCKEYRSEAEFMHINENYFAHGTCGKCQSVSHHKLEISSIFDNLRVGHMDKRFQLLLRKEFIPTNAWIIGGKFEENHLPPIEGFYSKTQLAGN